MIKNMFVVFDNKSGLYSSPFFSIRKETATRDLLRAAQSPESEIYHSPADYDVFCIGTYDDEIAAVSLFPQKEFITNALTLVRETEAKQS